MPASESTVEHGLRLQRAGRLTDAEQIYQDVLRRQPDHFDALHLLGIIATQTGRPELAVELLGRAIALRPGASEAYNNRGNALENLGRFEEALSHYGRAIALAPNSVDAYTNRGAVLRTLGRLEAALSSCDKAIALNPDFAEAHNNRGNALRDLGHFEAALASYDRAIPLNPDHAAAYNNRGTVLRDLGRLEAALSSYDRAIALRPDATEAYSNQSMCHLAMGDYERGWPMYEWRWNTWWARPRHNLPGVPWLGDSPIEGKTILVHAEQGLGDSLQFCRYVPELATRATVVLDVPRPLVRLLSGLTGVARIIASGDSLPRFDAWIPMMSLPLAFGTTLATIPASVPYLYADPERSATWKQRLAALPGRKVGLVWSGSSRPEVPNAFATDRRRSITLQHYAPLAAIRDVCLISLQKDAVGAVTPPEGMVLHDWTGELDDFADTAALVDALDLVVSVDTSVVHLAGALGKRVWVLNRYDQCWRWLLNRTDSPWYPTARLFRQHAPGDWSGVIRDVAEALCAGE